MWPQSKAADPDRWYNDDPQNGSPVIARNSCKDCPTGYQLTWYCCYYPYFDAEELWTAEGEVYAGVLRLRKWNTLVADYGASTTTIPTTPPDGSAWEAAPGIPNANNFNISMGIPAPSDMTKYFALPSAFTNATEAGTTIAGKYAGIIDETSAYWGSTTRPDAGSYLSASYMTYRPGNTYMWVSTGDYIERERSAAKMAVKFQ